MKMDKRFPPAKLTFRSDGKDRLFKRINKKNEIRVDRNTNTGDVRRKKGEKLSRAFFFFSPSKRVNGAFDVFRGPESRNLGRVTINLVGVMHADSSLLFLLLFLRLPLKHTGS